MKPYGGFPNDFDTPSTRKRGDHQARRDGKKEIDQEKLKLPLRAEGETICGTCGKSYWKHPLIKEAEFLDDDGNPYITRLCDGGLVEL